MSHAALSCSISPSCSFLICLPHTLGFLGFPEASHKKRLGSNQPRRQENAPRVASLATEMRLHVKKSSLISYNCLDLFIGKGQVGRSINHWWTCIGHVCANPELLALPPGSPWDGMRWDFLTFRVCQSSEKCLWPKGDPGLTSVLFRGEIHEMLISANRSLLLRAYYVPGQASLHSPLTSGYPWNR